MTSCLIRPLTAFLATLATFGLPAPAQACWLFNCFGHHNRTTFYAPVAAAPACNTCPQQSVSYVPQTAFRPLITTTPVTAFRPVTATDPCTGCPTTVMQPATSYVQRTVMMPYTTYRPVLQTSYFTPSVGAPVIGAPACPTGACSAAPTTTYYQPTAVAPAITTPAPVITQPGCCPTSPAPVTLGAPMSSATTAAPAISTAPPYVPQSTTPPRTFNNASQSPSDVKADALKPIPEAQENGASSDAAPLKLLDPRNRTTRFTPAAAYVPVALKERFTIAQPITGAQKLDDGGWEAAR